MPGRSRQHKFGRGRGLPGKSRQPKFVRGRGLPGRFRQEKFVRGRGLPGRSRQHKMFTYCLFAPVWIEFNIHYFEYRRHISFQILQFFNHYINNTHIKYKSLNEKLQNHRRMQLNYLPLNVTFEFSERHKYKSKYITWYYFSYWNYGAHPQGICDIGLLWLFGLGPLIFLLPKTFNLSGLPMFRLGWRIFYMRVVRTMLAIYVFVITIIIVRFANGICNASIIVTVINSYVLRVETSCENWQKY